MPMRGGQVQRIPQLNDTDDSGELRSGSASLMRSFLFMPFYRSL
jgi:hypothetical protein